MPRVNVQEETKRFSERLEGNFFATERSRNTEVNYAEKKEPRDTQAVKQFLETETFEYIKNME